MDYKYTVVILVLLFGVTLVVYAEHPHLQEINLEDRLEIKENVVITKWSDKTQFFISGIIKESQSCMLEFYK